MYEKNLRNYYNANYRKPASDDVRRSFDNEAWIRRSRKHLTTNDESDDELLEAKDYYGPRKKYILTEQSLGGALFLITIAIMIVQLIKIISKFGCGVQKTRWIRWNCRCVCKKWQQILAI